MLYVSLYAIVRVNVAVVEWLGVRGVCALLGVLDVLMMPRGEWCPDVPLMWTTEFLWTYCGCREHKIKPQKVEHSYAAELIGNFSYFLYSFCIFVFM